MRKNGAKFCRLTYEGLCTFLYMAKQSYEQMKRFGKVICAGV